MINICLENNGIADCWELFSPSSNGEIKEKNESRFYWKPNLEFLVSLSTTLTKIICTPSLKVSWFVFLQIYLDLKLRISSIHGKGNSEELYSKVQLRSLGLFPLSKTYDEIECESNDENISFHFLRHMWRKQISTENSQNF